MSTTATEANVTWKAPLFIGELFSKDDFLLSNKKVINSIPAALFVPFIEGKI